jgi:septum formation protein
MHVQAQTPTAGQQPADSTRLILASASPRRQQLLSFLGVPFSVQPTDAEERDDPVPPQVRESLPACPVPLLDHPTLRAWRKAHAIAQGHPTQVVLGADTVVSLDNTVLNKPTDPDHAHAMLARLAGRTHTVYTGLCVFAAQAQQPLLDLVASEVTLAPLQDDVIADYVATGEPLDKAGAYGIQGLGGRLVQQVVGSYTAVVGLPLPATWRLLTAAGVSSLQDPTEAYYAWLRSQQKESLPCPPTLP